MPKFLAIDQLSTEWHAARRGCLTASKISNLFGRAETREKYVRQVAAERITQEPVENFRGNYWTERGTALEAEARNALSFDLGIEITQTGLCISDISPWFVCSPDGLIGDASPIQIKCPAPQTHVGYVLNPDTLAADYIHQLMAEMVATDRPAIIIASYCPGMRLVTRTVTLTSTKCNAFTESITAALAEIETIVEKVKL